MTRNHALERHTHSWREKTLPTGRLPLELMCLPARLGPAWPPSLLPLPEASQSVCPTAHIPLLHIPWPHWKGDRSPPSRRNKVGCVISVKSGTSLGLDLFAYKTNLITPALPTPRCSKKNEMKYKLSPHYASVKGKGIQHNQ